MVVLAETLTSYDLIVEATGLPWKAYECGPWINNEIGKLVNIERLPRKKGIYMHYFVVGETWLPFYAGKSWDKEGVYKRIYCEYNKKQAAPAKSGPYEACLYLEYHTRGGLPIGILFHDMSAETNQDILQAEKNLLKAYDFCANTQNNGCRRLEDMLRVVVELDKRAKPYLNTVECGDTGKEVVEEPVVEEVEVSAELCRDMIHSYADVLHPDLFRKIQKEEQDEYHRRLYQRYKELLSDRENQRILEEVRG